MGCVNGGCADEQIKFMHRAIAVTVRRGALCVCALAHPKVTVISPVG
jgi:hypothetical protein